ncbi:MAG: hypothetical protein HY719_04315 [Planctomycetes bacterium]|nr:hypothetical protein [Planctomycetota bacterium]
MNTFLEAIRVVGILFGLILHAVLIGVIILRRNRKPSEGVFLALAFAIFLWFLGLTGALILPANPRAADVTARVTERIEEMVAAPTPPGDAAAATPGLHLIRYFHLLSAIGLVFIPPLMLHTVISFYSYRFQPLAWWVKGLLLLTVYAPTAYYLNHFDGFLREPPRLDIVNSWVWGLVRPLAAQTTLYFFAFSTILYRAATQADRRDEQKFYNALALTLVSIGIVVFVTYVVGVPDRSASPEAADYLDLLCILSPAVPTAVFSYYVYRYYTMEVFLRRSVLYFFASLMTLIAYAFLIGGLRQTLAGYERLNYTLVEGLLLVALFGLLQALIKGVGWAAGRWSGRSPYTLRAAVGELTRRMSFASGADADLLIGLVEERLQELFRIRPVRIVVDQRLLATGKAADSGAWTPLRPADAAFLAAVPAALAEWEKNGRAPFDLFRPPTPAQLEVLRAFDSEYLIPLAGDAGVFGVLSAGRRPILQPLLPEERELFVAFSLQLTTVLHNMALLAEKIALQARMFENEKLVTLGMLSATVAHEVRNPLSSIKAIVQVMAQDAREEPQKTDLAVILGEIDRLTRVVSQLLSFARGDARPVDGRQEVGRIVDDVLLLLKNEAAAKGIAVERRVAESVARRAVPSAPVRDALFNLVLNAVQAVGKGDAVSVLADPGADGGLRLTVKDTGAGIPEQMRDRVFEPFFTTKQTGTGLGLPIVRQRVESLGGQVRLRADGEPAKVTIELPETVFRPEEEAAAV